MKIIHQPSARQRTSQGGTNLFSVVVFVSLVLLSSATAAQTSAASQSPLEARIQPGAAAVEKKLIAWRRDIHQHPELGDQETRTSKLVAEHLRSLGMDVHTGVARTGVIGVLKGGKPGRVVALRADMDALPVKETGKQPFASKATATMNGQTVPVMHACGHDAHTAMLMATAEVLAGMKQDLPGTVMFIFQPAEEGSSIIKHGGSWGAKLILEEGWFKKIKPEAVFAVHVMPGESGSIFYREGATAASSGALNINVTGKQGHGGMPWNAIDPVTISALIVSGLQMIVSRETDLIASPAVVTVGTISGGSSSNIVAGSVHMTGTVRAYDEGTRAQLRADIRRTVEKIAEGGGGRAEVTVTPNYDVTVNDAALVKQMLPVLQRVSDGKVSRSPLHGAWKTSRSTRSRRRVYTFFWASRRKARTR